MILDFHTHVFPDRIAKNAISTLSEKGAIPCYTNGTLSDTLNKINACKISKFVTLNIATNPQQQTNVNNFAIDSKAERIIPFGSVHPDSPFAEQELDRLICANIKGIKLHHEYQQTDILDDKYMKIYEKCSHHKLILVIHAGADIAFNPPLRAPVNKIAELLKLFPSLKLVAAHLGGWQCWEDVLKYLVGTNVYLDTSFVADYIDSDIAKRIIERHDPERILFGSDCPWELPLTTYNFIESLGLDNDLKGKIYYKNAAALLGIS